MADPTYSLGPQPTWYLVDNQGRPTAGFLYTYSNLDKVSFKPTFSDIGGTSELPNPIPFAANGIAGPIYFENDTDTPDENYYYLRFYDANMNFLYDIENFITDGGGGGNVTTNLNLENFVTNNIFLYNAYPDGVTASPSPVPNNTILAPSNHSAFIDPDIRFFNDSVGATDSITFPEFVIGANPLLGDVTPQYYLSYTCGTVGSGEIRKYVQFPIQPKVKSLDDQEITVTIWAQSPSGSATLALYIKQFYGTGGSPSSTDYTVIDAPFTVSSTWTKYTKTVTIPSISLKTLGSTGDDAIYFLVQLPTDATTVMEFTKPSLYIGGNAPDSDFSTQEDIEALIETPRTGDLKAGMIYTTFVPGGWIITGTTTIGNSSSGATRAKLDTWFLFYTIWTTTSNTDCPILTSAGAASTRGASAQADWDANKRISLPNNIGAVISNVGNGHNNGSFAGTDTHSLTINELPSHKHAPDGVGNFVHSSPNFNVYVGGGGLGTLATETGNVVGHTGQTALSIIQPTTFTNYIIKL